MAEKKKVVKPQKAVTVAIGVPGRSAHIAHRVSQDKKGDVIVNHTNSNQGKYDKINLTKKAGVKNVKQGVKAVESWHKANPHKKKVK